MSITSAPIISISEYLLTFLLLSLARAALCMLMSLFRVQSLASERANLVYVNILVKIFGKISL